MNSIEAGMYNNKSDTRTVERMKTLLPGVSIPRDLSSSNHAGSIREPLSVERVNIVGRELSVAALT